MRVATGRPAMFAARAEQLREHVFVADQHSTRTNKPTAVSERNTGES
jgi:hypothetical protein